MMKTAAIYLTSLVVNLMLGVAVNGQKQDDRKGNEQTPVVVFVCEHGAAKSVVAAAHFNKLARERGLNLRAIARGTNPDKEIAPKAALGLQTDGLTSSESAPKRISKADLTNARRWLNVADRRSAAALKIHRYQPWPELSTQACSASAPLHNDSATNRRR